MIESELFDPYIDPVYGKISLIELFFKDLKRLKSKIKRGELREETVNFLHDCNQQLYEIHDTVSIAYFQEQKYRELLINYLDSNRQMKITTDIVSPHITRLIQATMHDEVVWRVYKSSDQKSEFYGFEGIFKNLEHVFVFPKTTDKGTVFITHYSTTNMVSNSLGNLPETVLRHNPIIVPDMSQTKLKESMDRYDNSGNLEQRLNKVINEKKRKESKLENQKREELKQRLKKAVAEKKLEEKRLRESKKQNILTNNKFHTLSKQDFVVRGNIFHCINQNHFVESITAVISLIDDKGIERQLQVNAGYCKGCNIYFIMDHTYGELIRQGIPLCRITSEDLYSLNENRMANESVLMQYGYTVSQKENLSTFQRQKILAVMIDEKVMGKNEILSYLNFFINQRKHIPKFNVAVSKWQKDRTFVEHYRIGEYRQYGVNAVRKYGDG